METTRSLLAGACLAALSFSSQAVNDWAAVDMVSSSVKADESTSSVLTGHDVSADGRYVVFASSADDLVIGDNNLASDIFIRDRVSGTTELISRGTQGNFSKCNGYSTECSKYPKISSDGRFVVYLSRATNLTDDERGSNNYYQAYLLDRETNKTILVSVNENGALLDREVEDIAISDDGNTVLIISAARNILTTYDFNYSRQVYAYDLTENAISLVTESFEGKKSYGDSQTVDISADGQWAVMVSYASDLVENDTNNYYDVYLKNLQTNETTLVSLDEQGNQATYHSYNAKISADGSTVVFESSAQLTEWDTTSSRDIYRYDIESKAITLVSMNNYVVGNGNSYSPTVSDDGRFIAFYSDASSLTPRDSNREKDSFVYDSSSQQLARVSYAIDGNESQDDSFNAVISGDGMTVVFKTQAALLEKSHSAAGYYDSYQLYASGDSSYSKHFSFMPFGDNYAQAVTITNRSSMEANIDVLWYHGGENTRLSTGQTVAAGSIKSIAKELQAQAESIGIKDTFAAFDVILTPVNGMADSFKGYGDFEWLRDHVSVVGIYYTKSDQDRLPVLTGAVGTYTDKGISFRVPFMPFTSDYAQAISVINKHADDANVTLTWHISGQAIEADLGPIALGGQNTNLTSAIKQSATAVGAMGSIASFDMVVEAPYKTVEASAMYYHLADRDRVAITLE